MKKCIIIDDEKKARLLFKNMLLEINLPFELVAECDDLPSGIKAIKKLSPDLVFIDIEMPNYSGMEILDFFSPDEVDFELIFITGYSEYAIQAFRLSAFDYLLKPLNQLRLEETLLKYLKKSESFYKIITNNLTSNTQDMTDKCLTINLQNATRFIKIKDMLFLEAEGSYCKIYLKNEEKLIVSKNLKSFEEKLVEFPQFYRCHKSYIINLKEVKEYNKSDYIVYFENKIHAMVSADKAEQFLKKMEELT